jgi:hypothetical protein
VWQRFALGEGISRAHTPNKMGTEAVLGAMRRQLTCDIW